MKQFLQLFKPFREMRKIAALSFMLFALIAIPMGMQGQTRAEVTYDFSEISGFDTWGTSYSQHVVEYDEATVTFASANHQTSTITDIPVTKGQPVSLELNDPTNQITSVTFVCRQWNTKAQTITLHYSTDGGTNYTSTNITSTNFTISSTSLPEGTNAVKITFNNTSNQVGIESVTFNIAANSSSAVATAITIDDANLTNTDVYVGTEAGLLSATVTAGETIISDATVNWASSDEDVATIDADGVVTLVAEGTTTITATYAGVENQYLSSSQTYPLVVANSAPFTGGDITFVAGTDLGTTTSNATGDEMTKSVVTVSSTSAAFATAEYRIYSGSTTTISTTYGVITQIAFTKTGNYSLANLSLSPSTLTGVYDTESGIWTGNATSVDFSASAQVRLSQIVVTVAAPAAVATPTFTPEGGTYFETQNVTITCETPNSVIYYTIDGTEPTDESILYSEDIPVAETTTIKAIAYVGADYSYVATATYTIEQPLSTIEEIFNAATNTATTHRIHFNNWVITGANNSNHSFLSDGTNGCMIYGSEQGFTAGDILSGIVECNIQKYNGSLELTGLNSSTAGLTVTAGGTVTVADIAMADLAGINTGALVSYESLTCSVTTSGNYTNYYLTDGTTEIQVYTTLYNDLASSLVNGKTYNITGVFVQNNNIKRINPRSAADIEEVQVQHNEYTLTVSDLSHVNLFIFGGEESETIISTEDGETTAQVYDGTEVLVSIDVEAGYVFQSLTITDGNGDPVVTEELTPNEYYSFLMPTSNVTITATAEVLTGDNYELFSGDLVEGDYLIVYNGKAMNNTVTNNRLQYEEVTATNNVIITDNAEIVWHIAPNGDYWTIYSADTGKYAASTGTKNQATTMTDGTDDKALWTVDGTVTDDGTETYEFVNKYNAANNVNSNLRENSTYGFACYASSTGGALSLYKRVTSNPCSIVLNADNEWTQNFDDVTQETPGAGFTGVTMGDCWTWTATAEVPAGEDPTEPQVFYRADFAHNSDYSLVLWDRGVYALPELDENIDINQLKMSFYVRQSYPFYTLLVGVMTDPTAPETFEPVAYVDNGTSTESLPFEFDFSKYGKDGRYIAFKNVRPTGFQFDGQWSDFHSVNYIDEIKISLMEGEAPACVEGLPYEQNFELVTTSVNALTGATPECWEVVQEDFVNTPLEKKPMVYYNSAVANNSNYSLRMANRCVYALPALDANVNEVQLSMSVLQPKKHYQLEVGVWDTVHAEFYPVTLVNNTTTGYEDIVCDFSVYRGPAGRIAFRNVLGTGYDYDHSYNYIDNIYVSLKEACNGVIVLGQTESFDGYSQSTNALTGDEPDCWELVQQDVEPMPSNKKPQLYYNGDDYCLAMIYRGVYAMPSLEPGVEIQNLHLSMNLRQTNKAYQLEVGVWEPGDESSPAVFVPVHVFNNNTTEETFVECDFTDYPGEGEGGRIAFRNTLINGRTWNYSYNYIDDVTLDYNNAPEARNNASGANVIDEIGVERYLEGIAVYPNPTTGVLHIGAMDVQKVECYNQLGQLVAVYDNESNISLNSLANGVYTLRITVPQGVTMRKVVKR